MGNPGSDGTSLKGLTLDPFDILCHEFRTPLSVLTVAVGMLVEQDAAMTDRERADMLAVMARQVDHLASLLARCLALRDIEHNDLHLELRPTDVVSLVRTTVADVEISTEPAITIDVHPREASVEQPMLAVADPEAVQQILILLLNNAVRYGEGKPVKVSVAQRNGSIEVSVRDHGMGVATGEEADIFEAYVRGDAGRPGLGIGLTLGLGLAQAQGGGLRHVAPPTGRGSVFVLSLPRVKA